jgi:Ca-activated chloride channel family protein
MITAYLPAAAAVALLLAAVGYLLFRLRYRALFHHPLLFLASLLALTPAIVAALHSSGIVDFPYLRVERPLVAYPATLIVLWSLARLETLSARVHPVRGALTELTSSFALLCAALAATGIELGRPLDRLVVLVAIDRSRSIDLVPGADARIAAELKTAETGMREDDRIGTVAFGVKAVVEDPLRSRSRLPAPQRAELGRDGTDLGAAIRHALGELPSDSAARIVLLSDGVSTRGDPLGAAMAAVAAGVPVDVVPLDQANLTDVRVASVRIAPRASEGEPVELRVVTQSTKAAEVEVRVKRDGVLIRRGVAKIAAGEDVLHLREIAPEPGFHRYDVELSATDPSLDLAHEDNAGATFMRVQGQATALVLDGRPELAGALVRALEAASFRVTLAGPTSIPADVAEFAAYDLVTLADIPASSMSPGQLEALGSYVRDLGGGLLLFGGDQGLGPGGYGKTPVEDVSPVSFDIKQDRRRASLAEVIAIDYSGSMSVQVGQKTKLELANEAAVRSAELLGSGDRLGVMHVDTAVTWTIPLGPLTDKAAISDKIRKVGLGGGGIFVDITLIAAYEALSRETTQLKHLLLFSDGDDAEERARSFSLARSAKTRGITTSVVALGQGSDVADLEQLSKIGGGRFYLIEDATRLPAVFAQETILAARAAINEVSFRPTLLAPGPPTRGIDFSAAPPLTGYVVTLPKGRTQVLLAGPESDPVLATWSVGLGRTAVFTSDFKDRWGVSWTSWAGAGKLFGQVARDLARHADDPRVQLEASTEGGLLSLRANVVDASGRSESFRRLKVNVAGPDGFSRSVELEAVGAGAYAATLPLERPGAYVATAVDDAGGGALSAAGAALQAGEELRPTGTDRAMLARIAELSSGKQRDTLAGIFHDRGARRFAYQSLAETLLWLGAALLLLAVAARRLALPEAIVGFPARLRARASAAARRSRPAAESIPPPAERGASVAPPAPDGTTRESAPSAPPTTGLSSLARKRAEAREGNVPDPALRAALAAKPKSGSEPPPREPLRPSEPPPTARGGGRRPLTAAEVLLERRRGRKR